MRHAVTLACLLLSLWCDGATPRDAFNESPPISSAPPIAQLNFSRIPIGAAPQKFETLTLNGHGDGIWRITGDRRDARQPHLLVYGLAKDVPATENSELSFDDPKPTGDRHGWAAGVFKDLPVKDGDFTATFKARTGGDARVALIYRYVDPATYYLLENDSNGGFFTLYRVQKGKWKVVNRISGIITADVWHTERLLFQNDVYEVFFDNELALGGRDKGLLTPGRVGVALPVDDTASFQQVILRIPPVTVLPSTSPR